ncbi:MAG: hypothetical protein QOE11_1931 [Solirubrobacteraceae bacterium]|jgi:hypothetical protein|nr:hypothetical protein [Solirubrobacteraceae bacterium]
MQTGAGRKWSATAAVVVGLAAMGAALPSAASATATSGVIAALPDTSGMELTYPNAPNSSLAIRELRGGVTLSTATAHTDATGAAAINGGGADCWQNVTPDLLPGDVIEVTGTDSNGPILDTMTIGALTSDKPVQPDPLVNTVLVHGTAANRPPEAQLEARIVGSSADRFDDPRAAQAGRMLRAGVGLGFSVHYDASTGGAWTATFPNLTAADVNRALNTIDSRAVILVTLNELTISQNPVRRGPGAGCTAPFSQTAITSTDHPSINIANVTSNLALSGVVQNGAAVTVALNDQDANTPAVTRQAVVTPGTGTQTWTASVPASAVAGLTDGTITASMTPTGGTLTMVKDTIAPGAPTANPSPGTYETSQSVTLAAENGSTIHYTNNGSAPTAASPTASGTISVTSSQTLKAMAVDPAGNPGPMAPFAYTITGPPPPPPAPPTPPTPPAGGSGGGGGTTIINQTILGPGAASTPPVVGPVADPVAAASSARPALALKQIGLAPLVKRAKAQRNGIRLSLRLPAGTEIIKVNVYRKTSKGLLLLSSGYKVAPSSAGVSHVAQSQPALRRLLTKGSYQVQVTPGYSKSEMGTGAKASFKVV